jgi:hypothetical protein
VLLSKEMIRYSCFGIGESAPGPCAMPQTPENEGLYGAADPGKGRFTVRLEEQNTIVMKRCACPILQACTAFAPPYCFVRFCMQYRTSKSTSSSAATHWTMERNYPGSTKRGSSTKQDGQKCVHVWGSQRFHHLYLGQFRISSRYSTSTWPLRCNKPGGKRAIAGAQCREVNGAVLVGSNAPSHHGQCTRAALPHTSKQLRPAPQDGSSIPCNACNRLRAQREG